jgi:PAS domain S-box-containing protein
MKKQFLIDDAAATIKLAQNAIARIATNMPRKGNFSTLIRAAAVRKKSAAVETSNLIESNDPSVAALSIAASRPVTQEIRLEQDRSVADYGLQKVHFPADMVKAPLTILAPDGRKLNGAASRKRFSINSIRGKLTMIVMVSTFASLLLALLTMGLIDTLSFSTQMRQDAISATAMLANNSKGALSIGDRISAKNILSVLAGNSNVGAASIIDREGNTMAGYSRPDWSLGSQMARHADYVSFTWDYIEVVYPVTLVGKRIGTVVMQWSTGEMYARLWKGALVGVCILIVAAGLGYLLTMQLQRLIATPIRNLANASRVVAVGKNYSIRVEKQSDDELGELTDGFNGMLSKIEARDKALREAQAELEKRVADRTRELFGTNQQLHMEVSNHKRAKEESDALREKLQTAYENLKRDAGEKASMQQKLKSSEERFSKAFKTSPVAQAILKRRSGVLVDVNDRFAELAGVERQKLIGSVLFSLPLWSVPETRARIEQLLSDGQAISSWECRISDGKDKTRHAMLSAESFQLGKEPCVLLMTEDISERVNLEGQLRQSQKMDAIGQLAAGVAHDFNNLLTVIQGYTQLLLAMHPVNDVSKEALEKIIAASQRAAGLTSQLLTFSRKQAVQPKAVDMNKVVHNVAGLLRPLLGENIRLIIRPTAQLPSVMANAGMLEQLLVNLAVNARDAMPKGGELIVSTFACDIDLLNLKSRPQASAGQFVCLQVSDSGTGMDTQTIERIFEPFFTTKGVGKGTGLGLATVYGIVKQHRGWVEVASQLEVGTTFKVFIPAVEQASQNTEFKANPDIVRGGSELIMVVEDEPALRELVTKVLRTYGYQVIEATHGKDALRVLGSTDVKPDLLLTDMMMPEGMSGWDLACHIRNESPDMKVVYTSGYSPEIFGGEVKMDSNVNFLPKPFHPRILAKTVRQCLDS